MGTKIPIVVSPDFTLYFELPRGEDKFYVHCDVPVTKKSVLVKMRRDWVYFRSIINIDLYAIHSDTRNNKPHKHFLRLFGFSYLSSGISKLDGKPYEIYINRGPEINAQI